MSVLVTGGAGYIGSHTAVELLKDGYDVVIVDNLSNSSEEIISRIEDITGKSTVFYNIDVREQAALAHVFENHQIEAVIHFAGFKAVGESIDLPLKYYSNNLVSTISLCEVMDKYNVYQLIFSSSATVYGMPEVLPLTEDCPTGALNPYGRTKIMAEEALRDLSATNSEWKIPILRYFNPIGAHPSGKIGESPSGIPNNLMPYITQVAIGKLDALNIFGGDYSTKDGTGVRDYIHVVDLAKGHIAALKNIEVVKGAEVFNLGTGKGYSVLEVVQNFEQASGIKIPYNMVERRAGDAAKSYADPSKANTKLGWIAKEGLYSMCKDAWNWQMKEHKASEEIKS